MSINVGISEIEAEIQRVWSEIRLMRWMIWSCLTGIGTLILKAFS